MHSTYVQDVLDDLRVDSGIRSQADPPLRRPVRPSRVSTREEPSTTPLFVLTYLPASRLPASHTRGHGAQMPPVVGSARFSILSFRKQAYSDSLLLADA